MKIFYEEKEFSPHHFVSEFTTANDNFYLSEIADFMSKWLRGDEFFEQKTSGSTGRPKKINIARKNMIASAANTINYLQLGSKDTALLSLNPAYVGGKMMIVRALEYDLDLKIGPLSNEPLQSITNDTKIDFFSFVPSQLNSVLKVAKQKDINLLNGSKVIIVGGAPVSEDLRLLIKNHLNVKVYSTFGMTETVSHVALKLLNEDDSLFEAVEGVFFTTDDENRLIVHAKDLSNVESLLTNDVVELADEKHFKWRGRYDFVINSGGIKLQAEEIELKIKRILAPKYDDHKFFLFGLPDPLLGEKICLCMESSYKDIPQDIKNLLKEGLGKYEYPKDFFTLPSFEYNNEKLNRKATILKIGLS